MSACDLSLVCSMAWQELVPCGPPDVRHCAACDRAVVMTRSADDRAVSFALGRCVAIAEDFAPVRWIGRVARTPVQDEEATHEVAIRSCGPLGAAQESLLLALYPLALSHPGAGAALREGAWLPIGVFPARIARAVADELSGHGMPLDIRHGGNE